MRTIVLTLSFLVAAFPLASQKTTPATTIQEALDVAVTSIDFVVTDSRGQRVHGLAAKDFEIYENGETRPITNFSEFGTREEVARSPIRYIIYFDNGSLSHANRSSAVESTRCFLLKLHATDEVMIVTSGESVSVTLAMTRNREAALAALDTVARQNLTSSRQSDQRLAEGEIRDIWAGPTGPTGRSAQAEQQAQDAARVTARHHIEAMTSRMRRSAAALEGVITSSGRIPGRKVLILFSEWLPTRPGEEINQFFTSLIGGRSGFAGSGVHVENTRDVIDAIVGNARRANVVISPVNPEGRLGGAVHDAGSRTARKAETTEAGAQPEAFRILAEQTGGNSFFGSQVDQALSAIATNASSYYSAGWKTMSNAPRFEKVEIRAKNPAHHVRLAGTVVSRSVGQDMTERTIAYHLRPSEENPLDISIKARKSSPVANEARIVPLEILVPVSKIRFRQEGEEMMGLLSFFVCAGEPDSRAFDVHQQTETLRLAAATVAAAKDQSITFTIDQRLGPNDDAVTVAVLDHESGKTGFGRALVPRE